MPRKRVRGQENIGKIMASSSKRLRSDAPIQSPVQLQNNSPLEGFIRHEVELASINHTGVYSAAIELIGLPWSVLARKNAQSGNLELYLSHRRSDSDMWSISVTFEFLLRNADNTNARRSNKVPTTFNVNHFSLGYPNFMNWADLVNEEKGFVKDGKITIECSFSLSNIIGIRVIPRPDFTDPEEITHDTTLVIEGQKIYVNKGILAIHSPVFKAMFYRNYAEKKMEEIKLKEVNRKDFIDMLNLIYPSYAMVTEEKVAPLLKLCDQFDVKTVMDKVELYVMHSKLSIPEKLKISEEYRLIKLQDYCLGLLTTVKDITDLKTAKGYNELSKNIKGTLMEKVMRLS